MIELLVCIKNPPFSGHEQSKVWMKNVKAETV